MIELKGVKKEYSGRCVLDIREAVFEKGKRYALLGTNGSGKSTLIKILAGTIKPSEGEVRSSMTDKKATGYLPQKPYGFSFTVLRNVMMAIEKCPEREDLAKAAIEAVGMEDFIKADASRLSGGETQRIAFARVIALHREFLILDEPTAATDLLGIDQLEAALLKYYNENGCAVIMATHSPAQAMRLCDELIFLHKGQIVEQGEIRQIMDDPKSEEFSAFLNHWRL